jgi:hypothetical protein
VSGDTRAENALSSAIVRPVAVLVGAVVLLAAGCAQRPAVPAAAPPSTVPLRAAAKPPDWFHQQLAAARAARRSHQPKADTVGAQQAYDEVMRNACTRAALAGPEKYPARCDAVLHPALSQPLTDPCDETADDPAMVTECND